MPNSAHYRAGLSGTECSLLSFPVVEERPDVQRVCVGFVERFLWRIFVESLVHV